jgi:hypothetical protein
VNFFDPTKLLAGQTGWAPKGHFALSRLTSDGRLFVWLGKSTEKIAPQVNAMIEVVPAATSPGRATLALMRFVDHADGHVVARRFTGNCEAFSGREAWDRFQKDPTK